MSALRKRPSGPATRRSAARHDVRREPVGGFARTLGPDAPVGTYGNVHRFRRQGTGTFAGDADRRRQGSFADAEPPAD